MLNMRLRHSLNLQFGAITVVHSILLLTLMHSCRAQPHVIGPSQPVVATLGDDVVLPCHLDPPSTAFKLTVEWTRPDLRPRFVLVLRHNVELDIKHPAYEGRTSLFSDELKLGNISLKLSRVRTSDEGGYRCFVPELNRDAAVQLVVGAASSPVIHMTKNSSSIDLQCNSTGWYPEPEVFWLDGEGNLLSAGPPETVRGPDDLYTVSSRVTVEKRHSNSFTCRVTQKKTNQTRETQIQVPVSDDFVEVPSASSLTSSVPAIVGAVLGIMFILAVAAGCFLWKWRQNKRSLEDGAELPIEEQTAGEESAPLMSGREENNVNNESQSQQENLMLEAQRETQQDQLMITSELITDMGGAGADGDNKRVSLIQTETETHQQQEMMRRREQNDCVKEERQEKKKPDKEDSEPSTVSISEGQREQPHNLQTDQEEKKEEETEEEKITEEKQPRREEDETEETSETKTEQKDNEQQREGKLDFRQKRKEKVEEQRRGRVQQKVEKRREDQRTARSKKREEDKIELKSQEDQKQEESQLEPEDKKDKDQEGNQNDRTREEESENGKEERKDKSKEKESEERSREPQLERQEELQRVEVRMELPTQKKNDNQEVLDGSKQETEHEDKRSEGQDEKLQESSKGRKKKQIKDTRRTERKAGGQNRQRNEKLERTDVKKEEGVNPSVSPAGPDRPDLREHQETAERNKQEVQQVNELQTEKQQRDKPQRNERERKEQPERSAEVEEVERSAEVVEEEGKGGQEERTDGGADREIEKCRQKQSEVKEETGEQQTVGKRRCEGEDRVQTGEDVKTTNQDIHMESDGDESEPSKEIEKHRPLQSDVKEETGESSKDLTQKGAESQDVGMEVEIDKNPVIHATYGNVKRRTWKWKEEEVLHVRQRYGTQLRKRRMQRRQNKTIICSMKKQQQHKKNEVMYELSLLVSPSFHQHTVQTERDVKMTNQDIQMDIDEDESDENRVCEPLSFYQHTAQTEEDRKMTNQDIHRDSDEAAAAPHSQQEVISESERLDYDSDLDRGSVCRETKKKNILSCTAF